MLRSITSSKLVLRKICKDIVCNIKNNNNNKNNIIRNNYGSISTFSTLTYNNNSSNHNNITKRLKPSSSLLRNVRYFSLVTEPLESLGKYI